MKLAYTVPEAQAATGLGRTTIYNLINDKSLVRVRVRGRTLITAESLEALVAGSSASTSVEGAR